MELFDPPLVWVALLGRVGVTLVVLEGSSKEIWGGFLFLGHTKMRSIRWVSFGCYAHGPVEATGP